MREEIEIEEMSYEYELLMEIESELTKDIGEEYDG